MPYAFHAYCIECLERIYKLKPYVFKSSSSLRLQDLMRRTKTMPPIFFTDPTEIPKRDTAELIRTPANKPLRAIITSDKIIASPTHYESRRTIPCGGPGNCRLCERGLPWRLHGYLSILNYDNLAHQILEVPAKTYDAIAQWYKQFGTIRGLYIELSRPNQKPNGSIHAIIKKPTSQPPSLPDPLPVQWLLCKIWNVPLPPDENPYKKNTRSLPQTTPTTLNDQNALPSTENLAIKNDIETLIQPDDPNKDNHKPKRPPHTEIATK